MTDYIYSRVSTKEQNIEHQTADLADEYPSAIVVEENGHYPSLAMPQYQINVRVPRKLLGEKLYPGQYFQIRFGKVDPLTNEIKVVEALEE